MNSRRNRRPRLGSRISSVIDTTLSGSEHTIKEAFTSLGSGATVVSKGLQEMVVESEMDLQDVYIDKMINTKSNISRLVEAGYSEEEAETLVNSIPKPF